MSMNPRTTTEKIKEDYQEYIESILKVRDREITELAHKEVLGTMFVKGPYLETTMPFVDGKTLEELAKEGLVSKEFSVMGDSVHYSDWKLRIHQEKALRKIISENHNMVVSTGTGSGKTECYLYPVFDSLMKEKEAGTLDDGVRALLIFPMNALANDQQKKLRKLLRNYPDITFGRYTGETEHKGKKESIDEAERRMHELYDQNHMLDSDEDLRKSLPNEYMCREKMAATPPHILLTNYAMLEFMLLRPDTAPFFDNPSAKNWQFIVIDEAHTYSGANGTEIAYLLRRLKERIRHNMDKPFKCIATSATLGDADSKPELAKFAQKLFDEPFGADDVIMTERKKRVVPKNAKRLTPSDYDTLKESSKDMDEDERGKYLFSKLLSDLRLFDLYDVLSTRPKRIEEVADRVFDDITDNETRENALITLIELSAAAKPGEYEAALLPARYHLFVKSLEGMFAQLYPHKSVFLDRKERINEQNVYYTVFELANCQKCEQEYLVGKISDDGYLSQTSSFEKPDYFFVPNNMNVDYSEYDEDDAVEEQGKTKGLERYNLCLKCGKLTPYAEKPDIKCCKDTNDKKIVSVFRLRYSGKDGESNCCPCCGATRKGLIKRFLTANQPATFAVAKSLYDAIPPRPISTHNENTFDDDIFSDDIFADGLFDEGNGSHVSQLEDESGRKLLIFSDNRQEAAFFAGFFQKKYNLLMWRKVILEVLKEAGGESLQIDDLIARVDLAADKSGLYTIDQDSGDVLTDDKKRLLAAHYVMDEFLKPDIFTGLEGLGYIEVFPSNPLNDKAERAGLKGTDLWNAIRFCLDTLRQKGAITYPDGIRGTDDFFSPRNHNGAFKQSGASSDREGYTYGFMPQGDKPNKRIAFMKKLIDGEGISDDERYKKAYDNLLEIYKTIMQLVQRGYVIETTNASNSVIYKINYSKWNVRLVKERDKLYRCNKCGRVYHYAIKDLCPEMRCDGHLEEISAGEIQKTPYYNRMFSEKKLIPMVAKEHTAQLSSQKAREYQEMFEAGKINVLSCSTTFEMGVDVGELEATFQRNVPPSTSNYIQRAGRAGRRTSSAAFSVTFSRRSSHDMTFFQEPAKIIAGKIKAPVLETENVKIAQRHLNSVVISWFFKRQPEFFENKTRRIVAYAQSGNMAEELRSELKERPQDLLESIHNIFSKGVCDELLVDEWQMIEDITGEEGALTKAIEERRNDIAGLRKFSEEADDDTTASAKSKHYKAMMALKLINTLEDEDSITFLSSGGVLPKYGFPIDTVSLNVISGKQEEAKGIDLQRDLKMAISEFAPPASIVANGKVWRSHAINTIPDKSWPTYIYHECPKCKRIMPPSGNVVDITASLEDEGCIECTCGTLMNAKKFFIPKFGFSTLMEELPRSVGETRPSTYYATQTQFWGIDNLTEKQKAEVKTDSIKIKGKSIKLTYSPGGRLFVLNQGKNGRGIKVCPQCGYATDTALSLGNKKHKTKFNKLCGNKSLITASLGHWFSTDILKIELANNYSGTNVYNDKDRDRSILYAILEGASTALDISRDDINGCVSDRGVLVLYDDTAGGSGFVKYISENFEKVLKSAKHKVSGICGCTEETSCYGCLRNYSNQFYHDELSRGLAYDYLKWFIDAEVNEENYNTIEPDKVDKIGHKSLDIRIENNVPEEDSGAVLLDLMSLSDEEETKRAYKALYEGIKEIKTENPVVDRSIEVGSENLWPELFWIDSKVAIFTEDSRSQYKKLKEYDWHCFIMDSKFDATHVIDLIRREG